MKKVLFVAHMQSHIMNFHLPYITYFEEKGYQVYIATKLDENRYRKQMNKFKKTIWMNIDFNRNPISCENIKALNQMINLMNSIDFELIHVHTPVGGIVGRIAAWITKSKNVIYTVHGFHFYKGAPIINWLIYYPIEAIMANLTDCIITINEEDYLNAKKFKIRGNTLYKVNGVGLDDVDLNFYNDIKEEYNISENDIVICMVGELNKNKNQLQLLKCIYELKHLNNIKVLLAGEGNMQAKLKEKTKNFGIQDKVIFLGWRNDIHNILRQSDILCSFSKREGLPKNIIEGMFTQKPIIASNIRGNKDLVIHNFNGYLVDVNDVSSSVNYIINLIENEEKRIELGRNNLNLIDKYTITSVLRIMDSIYSKFIT